MGHPLTQQGHEDGTDRVQEDKHDRHYDAVSEEDVGHAAASVKYNTAAAGGAAVSASAATSGAATAAVTTTRSAHKRVAVGLDSRLGQIQGKAGLIVMLLDALAGAGRVDSAAGPPSRNPRAGGRVEGQGAGAPRRTVGATDVGDHLSVLDTRAGEELKRGALGDLRHSVTARGTSANSDVAIAVSVHDEHVRVGHGRAGSQRNPLVASRGRHLKVQVSAAGAGSGPGDRDPEADIIGACLKGVGGGCRRVCGYR